MGNKIKINENDLYALMVEAVREIMNSGPETPPTTAPTQAQIVSTSNSPGPAPLSTNPIGKIEPLIQDIHQIIINMEHLTGFWSRQGLYGFSPEQTQLIQDAKTSLEEAGAKLEKIKTSN